METQIHKDEEMETVEKESVKRRRQNVYKGDAREIAVTKKIKEKRIKEGKMEGRKRERGKSAVSPTSTKKEETKKNLRGVLTAQE